MTNQSQCEMGMVGLGVMGRNLLLNIADHGFTAAGYDNDPKQADSLRQESQGRDIHATANIQEFMQSPTAATRHRVAGPRRQRCGRGH